MRYLILLLCVVSAGAYGQVLSVFIWDAPPGKDAQMYETAMKAKAMHEKLGAEVFIGTDQRGRMHYGMTFENAVTRGRLTDRLPGDEAWVALMNEASQREGAATLQTVHNLNTVVAGSPETGRVIMVFQWRPDPGRGSEFVGLATRAKQIHEKLGADVSIEADEKGHVFYAMNFASWEAQGKFADALAGNEEWSAFQAEVAKNPVAQQVDTYRITTMP
jgi:hypothetical protein